MADPVRPTPSTRLGRVDPLQGVSDLLQELKARSGRSYDALARRSGLSRSTVHRYCRGAIVPETFGPLEVLGRACGADRVELAELYALWSSADQARRAAAAGSPVPESAASEAPVHHRSRSNPRCSPRRRRRACPCALPPRSGTHLGAGGGPGRSARSCSAYWW